MKPVYQTERRDRHHTALKPDYDTLNQQRRYTVMKPVVQTSMVSQPYTVCRPVTTTRQVVEECGYFETQKTVVPGRVYERQVKVPVEDCGCEPRGFLSCLHKKKVWTTVAVQAPPRE